MADIVYTTAVAGRVKALKDGVVTYHFTPPVRVKPGDKMALNNWHDGVWYSSWCVHHRDRHGFLQGVYDNGRKRR